MNNINIKEILKIGIILFLITAISALLLAFVNKATAPVILQNKIEKTYKAMAVVMPDARDFKPIEYIVEADIDEAYTALNSQGEQIGYCIVSHANGYGGKIQVLVGIDADNTITGIEILSHAETPGLGANATKPGFKNQFTGKTLGVELSGNSDNSIDAMSGATITSKAVTNAVNIALSFAGGDLK